MLPVFLYPKDSKNTCISDLLYGVFYHIELLSLLIADKLMYKLTFRESKLFPHCRFSKINTFLFSCLQGNVSTKTAAWELKGLYLEG